jgi:hypothetical protein
MNWSKPNISPGTWKVLGAIMNLKAKGRHVTNKSIRKELGHTGVGWVANCLKILRIHGLISFEDRLCSTTVLTHRFIPADRLETFPVRKENQ